MRAETSGGERARVLVLGTEADTAARWLREHYALVPPGLTGDAEAPELIVLGVPGIGVEALARLRAVQLDPRRSGAPVVVMGERIPEELHVRMLEAGAFDVLDPRMADRLLQARLDRAIALGRERRELASQAQTDALTGLPNFRALSARLAEEFRRAVRYRYPLALAIVDLDHFKRINDRFGHEVGNRAIQAVAEHLRQNLRDVDFAARFGGDEFVVLLPHQTVDEASIFAERVGGGVALPVPTTTLPGFTPARLTLSIGIAGHSVEAPRSSPEALLETADEALYAAKRGGRNRFEVAERLQDAGTSQRH